MIWRKAVVRMMANTMATRKGIIPLNMASRGIFSIRQSETPRKPMMHGFANGPSGADGWVPVILHPQSKNCGNCLRCVIEVKASLVERFTEFGVSLMGGVFFEPQLHLFAVIGKGAVKSIYR
jgi:hypothetical protein